MAHRSIGPRHFWQLATILLLGGSVLLASVSGDPLLLLAVLSASAGLIVLSLPRWVRRPAAMSAVPGIVRREYTGDSRQVTRRSPRTSLLMARHQQRLRRPGIRASA